MVVVVGSRTTPDLTVVDRRPPQNIPPYTIRHNQPTAITFTKRGASTICRARARELQPRAVISQRCVSDLRAFLCFKNRTSIHPNLLRPRVFCTLLWSSCGTRCARHQRRRHQRTTIRPQSTEHSASASLSAFSRHPPEQRKTT